MSVVHVKQQIDRNEKRRKLGKEMSNASDKWKLLSGDIGNEIIPVFTFTDFYALLQPINLSV